MSWNPVAKSHVKDVVVHVHVNAKDAAVRVICMHHSKAVGLLLFDSHNDVANAPITYVEFGQFDDGVCLLAGWQTARSMRIISRKSYVYVREWLCGMICRNNKQKRSNRHRLTRASSAIIANLMRR